MKKNYQETMLYRNWLNLSTHLLWCYDHKVHIDSIDALKKSYSEFNNNAAWLVRSGWARVEHNNKVYHAGPGQWIIVKPTLRIQTFEANSHILSVAFDARWPDGSRWLDEGLSVVFDADECPELEEKAIPMTKVVSSIDPSLWDLRRHQVSFRQFLELEKYLNDWFITLIDVLETKGVKPTGHFGIDERVSQALRLLNAKPIGEALDQQQLASNVGLSLIHLTRLFQNDIGLTPKAYFENIRIEHACQRLHVKGERIKDVAIELGFSYISNFSNWFHKQTNLSPREYIAKYQNSDHHKYK
ncbi:helix-turn-helix domain-containing protein [Lentisphaerota bacterium WC36G]|nr:helix-turn-helix domain-containing protein [Lentisphaerae bacterium WC36]